MHECLSALRCQANLEQIRQSRPDSGLGFQVIVNPEFVSTSLESDLNRLSALLFGKKKKPDRLFSPFSVVRLH